MTWYETAQLIEELSEVATPRQRVRPWRHLGLAKAVAVLIVVAMGMQGCGTDGDSTGGYQNEGDSAPFWRSPFLMTHDAGTGLYDSLGSSFWKTQYLDLVGQLTCGVRSYDLRPVAFHKDYDQIHYHHVNQDGVGWISKELVTETIPGVVEWCNQHPSELVVIVLAHCGTCEPEPGSEGMAMHYCPSFEGAHCLAPQTFIEAFTELGVKVQTDCEILSNWTLQEAKNFSRLEGGGMLLLIPGENYCVTANYDPDVTMKHRVEPYVGETMSASLAAEPKPFQVQSFVQQTLTVPNIVCVNDEIYQAVSTTSTYDGVNFLEINLACSYGPAISRALGATITDAEVEQCIEKCRDACTWEGACVQDPAVQE